MNKPIATHHFFISSTGPTNIRSTIARISFVSYPKMNLNQVPVVTCSQYDYDACRSLYIDRARRMEEYRDKISKKCDTCNNNCKAERKSSMERLGERNGKTNL